MVEFTPTPPMTNSPSTSVLFSTAVFKQGEVNQASAPPSHHPLLLLNKQNFFSHRIHHDTQSACPIRALTVQPTPDFWPKCSATLYISPGFSKQSISVEPQAPAPKKKKFDIRHVEPSFRGWTVPGPLPDVENIKNIEPADGETIDALSGHFRIFQLKRGHRFSTDDVLTAWYGTSWCPSATRVLDLGSGIGSVGMTAAWRLPAAQFVTVEAQPESVQLAKKSAAYNGLLGRYDIRQGDFRDPDVLDPEERFDLILGSPPYFPLDSGSHGDHPQKIACRFEVRGTVADYAEIAARHINPGGVFACVFPVDPPHQLARVKDAAQQSGWTIIRWRPVVLREGNQPLIGLFAMIRSQDLPEDMRDQTWQEPPLIIRTENGDVHPEYRAVKLSFGFPP